MGRGKRGFEIADEAIERPNQGLPPRDENIVIAGKTIKGKYGLCCRPQPPFGPVALDCAPDPAAGRQAKPYRAIIAVRHGAKLQSQAGGNAPDALGRSQEIGALFQTRKCRVLLRRGRCSRFGQADNFFRPCARRRASTLRPPTVAMRARKP
jgi:hypothetical protein